ncbi:hypothetical protein cyc_04635 [Cyclospora cayetanensis]|uniref:Uncharacterized protein n=1 Tax=Cyclospora cayetanensis TaxID=88456 RepID=A0A1D3CTM7_9EIME|nr:hypothetical protein cyc_04635 [Cyclospora cayetanensis]
MANVTALPRQEEGLSGESEGAPAAVATAGTSVLSNTSYANSSNRKRFAYSRKELMQGVGEAFLTGAVPDELFLLPYRASASRPCAACLVFFQTIQKLSDLAHVQQLVAEYCMQYSALYSPGLALMAAVVCRLPVAGGGFATQRRCAVLHAVSVHLASPALVLLLSVKEDVAMVAALQIDEEQVQQLELQRLQHREEADSALTAVLSYHLPAVAQQLQRLKVALLPLIGPWLGTAFAARAFSLPQEEALPSPPLNPSRLHLRTLLSKILFRGV